MLAKAMAGLEFHHVAKVYRDGTRAVDGLTLKVVEVNSSSSLARPAVGKTTALLMVAGLEDISEATISIGGRVVNDVRRSQESA